MDTFESHLIRLFETIHPLDRIARAGYVLRGVAEPESVAAHSHFVSVMTLLFVKEYPDLFDAERALTIALVHDLSESQLMDIPMPAADAYLREAKDAAEQKIAETLFEGLTGDFASAHQEFTEGLTAEARLVRGIDKAQMMVKIMMYEREGRGRLAPFWLNPKNFADFDLPCLSKLFDAICEMAGHAKPTKPLG